MPRTEKSEQNLNHTGTAVFGLPHFISSNFDKTPRTLIPKVTYKLKQTLLHRRENPKIFRYTGITTRTFYPAERANSPLTNI